MQNLGARSVFRVVKLFYNNLNGFKDFITDNGSRQSQNLAVTGLSVPSSLDGKIYVVLLENHDQILILTIFCDQSLESGCALHGYLAHKKMPNPWHHHRALCIGLL